MSSSRTLLEPLVRSIRDNAACISRRRIASTRVSSSSGKSSSSQAFARSQTRGFSTSRIASFECSATSKKAEVEVGLRGRLASVVPPRRCKEITHRIGSKFAGSHSLKWITPPRKILIVKKANDSKTAQAMEHVIRYVRTNYPQTAVVVEEEITAELSKETLADVHSLDTDDGTGLREDIDLIITLGGDGTVLHVASLFAKGASPPVLGISMGTLGFLMPYELNDFEKAFDEVMASKAAMLLRMRLQCVVHDAHGKVVERFEQTGNQALNEVHLHRGRHAHLTLIETFVDGQHLTEAIADGLIVSTPTGSTAYSLSAGGPIVHPTVPTLVLTPICPRSLSFRSVLLPSDVCIQMRVSSKSRGPVELSIDGRSVRLLEPSEYLCVSMSPYPVPCIVPSEKRLVPAGDNDESIPEEVLLEPKKDTAGQTDEVLDGGWVQDINGMLSFNKAFVTKGMRKHVEDH